LDEAIKLSNQSAEHSATEESQLKKKLDAEDNGLNAFIYLQFNMPFFIW
jgi:hypothetical protein